MYKSIFSKFVVHVKVISKLSVV